MKKLLSILIITMLTTNTPAPLLASTVQTRVKRDVETTKTDFNIRVIKTDGANKPTAQQIKDKLKELNPQLDITKINVTNITHNSATITSNDENIYTKNVIINYTVSMSSLN